MNLNLKQIWGNWEKGYALDKHVLRSTFLGNNEHGHPQFDTVRSEAGESVYQLKYRNQWEEVANLATAVAQHVIPLFDQISLIVPMPASKHRPQQPVHSVSTALAAQLGLKSFENILLKQPTDKPLKDMSSREEKDQALAGKITLNKGISNVGKWNVLLIDDLYDTGASMEAACAVLRTYEKINQIFVVALTWK